MFNPIHAFSLRHRLTAVLGVALVLLLNVLAVSPQLHAWIHSENNPGHLAPSLPATDDDSLCPVTLFANGVDFLLMYCLLVLARPLVRSIKATAGDWSITTHLRYWHAPSHAPPVV